MSVPVFNLGGLLIVVFLLIICGRAAVSFVSWMVGCCSQPIAESAASHPGRSNASFRGMLVAAMLIPFLLAGLLFIRSVRHTTHVTQSVETTSTDVSTGEWVSYPAPEGDPKAIQARLSLTMQNLREARQAVREALRDNPGIVLPDNDQGVQELLSAILKSTETPDAASRIVTLDLSAKAMAALTAEDHSKLLKAWNLNVPGRLRLVYELIPLTAPGAPLPPTARSIMTVDNLKQIAAAVFTTIRQPDTSSATALLPEIPAAPEKLAPALAEKNDASRNLSAVESTATPESDASVQRPAEVTVEQPEPVLTRRIQPTWIKQPDPGRVVVETTFAPTTDDTMLTLSEAVSNAFQEHLIQQTATSLKPATEWSRLIDLNLSEKAVQTCIVETYEREEVIETREGQQPMKKTYALIEFPEAIDNAALLTIRQSVQRHRMGMIATALGLLWLAMLTTGLIIRFATGGSRRRRAIAVVAILLMPLPLIGATTGIVVRGTTSDVFEFPWQSLHQPVTVNVPR